MNTSSAAMQPACTSAARVQRCIVDAKSAWRLPLTRERCDLDWEPDYGRALRAGRGICLLKRPVSWAAACRRSEARNVFTSSFHYTTIRYCWASCETARRWGLLELHRSISCLHFHPIDHARLLLAKSYVGGCAWIAKARSLWVFRKTASGKSYAQRCNVEYHPVVVITRASRRRAMPLPPTATTVMEPSPKSEAQAAVFSAGSAVVKNRAVVLGAALGLAPSTVHRAHLYTRQECDSQFVPYRINLLGVPSIFTLAYFSIAFHLFLFVTYLFICSNMSICQYVNIIMSISLCRYQYVNINMSISLCRYQYVNIIMSTSLCQDHCVDINMSISISLWRYQYVDINMSISFCRY